MKNFLIIFLVFNLSGCITLYENPAQNLPRATVTFKRTGIPTAFGLPYTTAVYSFKSDKCDRRAFMGGLTSKNDLITVEVLAGEPLVNSYITNMADELTKMTTIFTPRQDHIYEILIDPRYYSSKVEIFDITSGKRISESSVIKPQKICEGTMAF